MTCGLHGRGNSNAPRSARTGSEHSVPGSTTKEDTLSAGLALHSLNDPAHLARRGRKAGSHSSLHPMWRDDPSQEAPRQHSPGPRLATLRARNVGDLVWAPQGRAVGSEGAACRGGGRSGCLRADLRGTEVRRFMLHAVLSDRSYEVVDPAKGHLFRSLAHASKRGWYSPPEGRRQCATHSRSACWLLPVVRR